MGFVLLRITSSRCAKHLCKNYFKILPCIRELQTGTKWLHVNIQAASVTLTFSIGLHINIYSFNCNLDLWDRGLVLLPNTSSWYAKVSAKLHYRVMVWTQKNLDRRKDSAIDKDTKNLLQAHHSALYPLLFCLFTHLHDLWWNSLSP